MSDNKYYTPSIEELCPEFECDMIDKVHESGFSPVIIGIGEIKYVVKGRSRNMMITESTLKRMIYEDEIRVKYLDQTDIESFEFIEDKDAEPIENVEHIKFEKHRIDKDGRLMNLEFSWMWLNNQPFILISECEENSEDDFEILFQGYCKNKSRLKQILTWTGILK